MAWYEIEYKCGHKDRMQLYGPYTERNRKIEWYKENVICSDCRAAKQKEEAAQQKKADAESGLPELSGSPKRFPYSRVPASWKGWIRRKKELHLQKNRR